jgi:hypothetical protein
MPFATDVTNGVIQGPRPRRRTRCRRGGHLGGHCGAALVLVCSWVCLLLLLCIHGRCGSPCSRASGSSSTCRRTPPTRRNDTASSGQSTASSRGTAAAANSWVSPPAIELPDYRGRGFRLRLAGAVHEDQELGLQAAPATNTSTAITPSFTPRYPQAALHGGCARP